MSIFTRGCLRINKCSGDLKNLLRNSVRFKGLHNLNYLLTISRNYSIRKSVSSISDEKIEGYLEHVVKEYRSNNDKDASVYKVMSNYEFRQLTDERDKVKDDLCNLDKMVEDDKEMLTLIDEEKEEFKDRLKVVNDEILQLVFDTIGSDDREKIIMEISAGAGGQEAMLFCKDLYNMYVGYFDYLGYEHEIVDVDQTDVGGARYVSVAVSGRKAFEKLRHEGGVHRVQRVPVTEKSGRMHTSTVSIAVLPQATEIEVVLKDGDLKIETKRASSAGGQHVNKVESAVRITHLPTGFVTECQVDRAQSKNKSIAMMKLRTMIYNDRMEKQLSTASELRKKQMGMGNRNEKIRTYNFNQDRVTDHRIGDGTCHDIHGFMEGGTQLEELGDKLQWNLQKSILIEAINSSQKPVAKKK